MKSLKARILLMLLLVFVLYGTVDYVIQHFIIFPSFVALERDEARNDVERVVEALSREVHHFDALAHDWAAWDDTYEFVQVPSEEYLEANLVLTTFTINDVNLLYFYDIDGTVVWGEIYNLETEEKMFLENFPNDVLPKTHPLIVYETDQGPLSDVTVAGVFMTGQGPMLIASRPVLTSNNEGPIRGSAIFGRFLNENLVNRIVEQTRVDFQVFPIEADLLPEAVKDIPNQLVPESPYLIEETDDDHLQIYTIFPDIKGDAALLIQAEISRKISARGTTTIRYAIISVLAAGLVVLVVMLLLLQRTVLSPIIRLTHHALSIGKTSDLSARLSLQRQDEIGTLSREFDSMLEQLSEARKKLSEQSYRSGMAEIASGVLHNVGNSLSSIIGQIELLRDNLRKTPMNKIEIAQQELSEGAISDERREDLIKYALLANTRLINVVNETQVTLDDTTERIVHIGNILNEHQKWALDGRPDEQITLEEVVHDSIRFLNGELHEAMSVTVDPSLATIGSVTIHRLSLLQVFANVLTNAAESIRRKGLERGEVHIRAAIEEKVEREMVHVQICDNGAGIEADTLEHIFERGFSTKHEKSSGIGLHWCANTITAMNGRLYATSEGRGEGACFHLVLPKISRKNS